MMTIRSYDAISYHSKRIDCVVEKSGGALGGYDITLAVDGIVTEQVPAQDIPDAKFLVKELVAQAYLDLDAIIPTPAARA